MTVLVTGARGHVGRAVLDALLAAGVPAHDVRVATSGDPARLAVPAGVEAVTADLTDPATLPTAFDGVDQAFLYAAGDATGAVAVAARDAGVSGLVLLSSLAALDDDPADRIGARHRDAETALLGSGLVTTLLRPGAFATNALGWADGLRAGRVELPYPDAHVTPIDERDIADVAVAALTGTGVSTGVGAGSGTGVGASSGTGVGTGTGSEVDTGVDTGVGVRTGVGGVRGTAPSLTGPASLSFREQVRILAAELGRTVEVVALDPDAFRERTARRGAPPWVADTLLRLWAASDGVPQPVEDVSRVLGSPGRTFAQWAHDHRGAFA